MIKQTCSVRISGGDTDPASITVYVEVVDEDGQPDVTGAATRAATAYAAAVETVAKPPVVPA